MSTFDAGRIEATLTLDRTPFNRGVQEARTQGKKLAGEKFTVKLDADASAANRKIDELRAKVAKLSGGSIRIDADTTKATAAMSALQSKVDRLSGGSVTIRADTSAALQRVNELEQRIGRLTSRRYSTRVDADTTAAQNQLNILAAQLSRISGQTARVGVDADTGAANAELTALRARIAALEGARANVSVGVSGGGNAQLILAAIVAGLGAIGYAAPAAAAALAAIPAALSGAGQAIGAIMSGFSGIGDALKAQESQEKQTAGASSSAGNQRAAAARQVQNAQIALQQAVQQQARASVQGAQQIASAERTLSSAMASAARTRIQGDQQVRAARQALADAVTSANQRVQSAERSLENAQRSRQYAQEALTRATKDAIKANRDLQLSVSGAALSEERATLSLAQARERLAKGSSDPLEMADLQLSVREAEQNLNEVKVRYGDLRDEQNEFARTGVAGTDQVRAATRALEDSQRGVIDAQRGVTEAQVSGAQQIARAQEQVARASQQAAWANEDAARAVADAQLGVQQAVQQAAWSQEDAAAQVAAAQRALADAYTQGGESASAAANKAADAMAKLTPEGREFVRFMREEWNPTWKRMSDTVAGELLPRVQGAMRNLMALQPTLTTGLAGTARVLGDLALQGSAMMASPAFQRDFATIMESNNRALMSFGQAGLSGVGAMTSLGVAAAPVVERFARLTENSAQAFESFILGKASTGELTNFLQGAADRLGEVVDWFQQLAMGAWGLIQGLAPLGGVLLDITGAAAEFIGNVASWNPVLTSVVGGFALAAAGVWKLGGAIAAVKTAGTLAGITTLGSTLATVFNPAAATAALNSTRLGQSAQNAGGKTAAFAGAATRVAGALPLVGAAVIAAAIANDALNTSFDEGVEAMGKGGAAAQAFQAEMARNDAVLQQSKTAAGGFASYLGFDWVRANVAGIQSTADFNAELQKQRGTWSNLQNAQYDATQAQGNYEAAVRQFGTSSPQAITALQNLDRTTRDVEIAQIAAREKTDLATAAILYQQETILGSLNADLRKRQAVQQLAQDQQGYADAIRQHGPASAQAEQAGMQLEQTQLRVAEAARSGRDGMAGYARSIGDMVTRTQGELTPTLAGMVQSLDWAGLSAAGAQVKIDGAGRAVAMFPNGKTVVLDANTSMAVQQINFTRDLVNSTRGTIGVDADPTAGVAKVGGFKLTTDATTGVVKIDGNISPADQQRLGIQAKTDGTTGTMWINGNPVPCDGQLNGARFRVDTTTGVMSIDADPRRADAQSAGVHDRANNPESFDVNANPKPAEDRMGQFFGWLKREVDELGGLLGFDATQRMLGRPGYAQGGLVQGYALGGGVRGYAGGAGGSHRIAASDTVPAMLTPGEFVVRKSAVDAVGVPALNAINAAGYALGGPVGFAAGGQARKAASAAPGAAAAPAAAPTVDPAQQTAAAGATSALTGALATQAAVVSSTVLPALAAQQMATAAVQLGQQNLVVGGITPLVGAMLGSLFPTLATYQQQVGVAAPLANTNLQTAQLGTQLSTTATALNTALNSTAMAGSITSMSQQGQLQHAMLRQGQLNTQLSSNQTALNTLLNNQNMTATTAAMSTQAQFQHQALRTGQLQTRISNDQTQQNTALNNQAMSSSTGQMSQVSQGHLATLRQGQQVTNDATRFMADWWRDQMGRMMPDSGNPVRWIMNNPINGGIIAAWNSLDQQFALGKRANPIPPGFASGGVYPGYTPGRDIGYAHVSGGEAIMRPEWTRAVGSDYVNAANAAARAGGQSGVSQFLNTAPTPPAASREGAAKLKLMRKVPNLDDQVVGAFAPGGVAPHVARASDEIERVFGRMPGGVGGLGARANASDHPKGLALDFMTLNNMGLGDRVAAHLQQNSARMAVKYLIWRQRINSGGGWKGMENRGSRTANHMDHVHASFTGSGVGGAMSGGGGFFDPTPAVDAAFAKTYEMINQVPQMFGPSDQVARMQGIAKQGADKVRQKALDQLMTMFGSGAGMDVSGIGGPVVEQVRQVAARFGWGQGPEWDAIVRLVQKESGWRPNAANPSSSARGLFQKMTSIHGPLEPTPAGQAAWGLNYIRGRYGTPSKAWAFHTRNNYYDNGGWLPPGESIATNHTGRRENKAVFTEDQWKAMQGQAEAARRAPNEPGPGIDYERLASAIVKATPAKGDVHVHPRADQSEERIGQVARRELDWGARVP